jgi:hypothetical protein
LRGYNLQQFLKPFRRWFGAILPQHGGAVVIPVWNRGRIMASLGSFAWFFVGLFVGQVTLLLFLAVVRQDCTIETAESLPIDAHEPPARRKPARMKAA